MKDNFPVEVVLEQYKVYVEMADRISQRRATANSFFIGINTIGISLLAVYIENSSLHLSQFSLTIIFSVALLFLLTWIILLRSYKNLNTAKFKVIGMMEKSLPFSPYWEMEWKELGEGKSLKKYIPLTIIETIIPVLFGIIYAIIFIYSI